MEERKNAEYEPDTKLVKRKTDMSPAIITGSDNLKTISVSKYWLNTGKAESTIRIDRLSAMNTSIMVSPMNCRISWALVAPTTFLTPTSRVLLKYLAVVRFMKLIHAMASMIIPRIVRSLVNIFPFCSPFW